jgi:hypothetical protein
MKGISRGIWLRTDEIEEFIGGLEYCAELATMVGDNVMRWKWLILALHNTLQGACTCALRGQDTSGISVLTESSAKTVSRWLDVESRRNPSSRQPVEKLASMLDLYERVQKVEYLREPHRLSTHNQMNEDINALNKIRNKFSHFIPMGLSLEVSGMPRIVQHCCDVIEHLAIKHPTFWHHLEDAHATRIATGLSTLRAAMEDWETRHCTI